MSGHSPNSQVVLDCLLMAVARLAGRWSQGTSPISGLVYAAMCGTNRYLSIFFRAGEGGPESRDGSLSVLGFRFALPETFRRHFLRAVAAAACFVLVAGGDFGFVSRHKPAEHRIPDVSATPDVEASSITSCCGRRVSLSLKDVVASQYVCSCSADNVSSISLRFLPRE